MWPLTIRLPSKQAFFGLCAPEWAPDVVVWETRGTALKAGWPGEYNRRCGRFEWEGREPAGDAGARGHTAFQRGTQRPRFPAKRLVYWRSRSVMA